MSNQHTSLPHSGQILSTAYPDICPPQHYSPSKEERKHNRILTACKSFAMTTSAHGLPHIGEAESHKVRILWVFIFICSFSMFIYQFNMMIHRFLRYDKIVEIQINFEQIAFPAVTICGLNPYKKTAVENVPSIKQAIQVYDAAVAGASSEKQGNSAPKRSKRRAWKARYKHTETMCKCEEGGPNKLNQCVTIEDLMEPTFGEDYNYEYEETHHDEAPKNIPPEIAALANEKCLCFHDTQTDSKWPCYQEDEWIKMKCAGCQAAGNCPYPENVPINNAVADAVTSVDVNNDDGSGNDVISVPSKIKSNQSNVTIIDETLDSVASGTVTQSGANDNDDDDKVPCRCSISSRLCVVEGDYEYPTTPWAPFPDPPTTTPKPEDLVADFGFENIADGSALQSKAKENLIFLVSELDRETKIGLSVSLSETIRQCSFAGKDCDIDRDMILHVDPSYGNCYTFNHNVSSPMSATRPGSLYGLRVLLFSNKSEYLSTTESYGMKIAVNHQEDYPFPDTFGFNAPVGFLSSFAVRMQKLEALPAPYGECMPREQFNLSQFNYLYGNYYSMEGCHRSCVQEQLIKICQCADARYPLIGEHAKVCGANDRISRHCLETLQQDFSQGDSQKCKHCRQPCNKTVFTVSYSSAKWPTESSVSSFCSDGESIESCFHTYKEQASFVEVYFEQVNYEKLRELEAYGFVNLLSDFGGQISLWMGFSVITGIEVFVFVFQFLAACFNCPETVASSDNNSLSRVNSGSGLISGLGSGRLSARDYRANMYGVSARSNSIQNSMLGHYNYNNNNNNYEHGFLAPNELKLIPYADAVVLPGDGGFGGRPNGNI